MSFSSDEVPTCIDGHHRPRRRSIRTEAGVQRALCRDCGCALMRTASRRWFQSGLLGAATARPRPFAAGQAFASSG